MKAETIFWTIKWRWLIAFVILSACVDEIHFNVSNFQFQTVVDGMITDGPGPYTVKVSKSLNLNANALIRDPIQNAKIKLFGDQGEVEDFTETAPGVYQTGGIIQGQIGHSYHIVLTTQDGKVFQSEPDLLSPVGAIKKISPEFEPIIVPTFYGEVAQNIFNIFVDGDALEGDKNYVRWRFTGTYKVVTYPKKRIRYSEGYPYLDPPPCSGYVVDPALNGGALTKVGDCTCCVCWITQYEVAPQISDGQFITGNEFKHVKVAEVPINDITFTEKYLVSIEQMSLSKTAYDFFRLIRAQSDGTTSLFQPPSGQIVGNLSPVNSSETVLGLFWATSINTQYHYIERSDVPYLVPAPDSLFEACTFFALSDTLKPAFWQ